MRRFTQFSMLFVSLLVSGSGAFSQYAPILSDTPVDVDLECAQSPLPPGEVSAVPNEECGEVAYSFSEFPLCIEYRVYDIDDPSGTEPAIIMFYSNSVEKSFNWVDGARLFANSEQAFLVGDVIGADDPSLRYAVFMRLEAGRSWEEWSSLMVADGSGIERTFKDFGGFAAATGTEPWTDWRYYEADQESSQMSGKEGLSGSSNRMVHVPNNKIFAFQVGEAANGLNAAQGLSGWSGGAGNLQGSLMYVINSIYADITLLGTVGELYCDDVILRTWTATNACDLRITATQLITTSGGFFSADVDGDGSYGVGDFTGLNSAFGGTCADCPPDINKDGVVDVLDFLEFNSAFSTGCE